jgi:hypothetical protein
MSGVSDLPLHAQKAVVGRLLGFQVLAPQVSWLQAQGYQDAASRLTERLCWLTNEELDDPEDQEPLGSFLENLIRELQAEGSRLPDGAREAVAHALHELSDLVTCFLASPYDPLEQLVVAVAQTAIDFYLAYGAPVPPTLWDQTLAIVSFLGGRGGFSFAPDIHLQVRTQFAAAYLPSARVFLTIAPRWLDAKTIATIPRALLHEYISHVPQGPHMGTRKHPDANDMFAEGWMDYIAHQIHRSVLERRESALANYLLLTWTALYDTAAERFFGARCSVEESDWAAAARCEGAAAARQTHDLLRHLPETAVSADEYLYRLSFEINASNLDVISRRRVAAEIRRCLLLASHSDTLVPGIRDWAQGKIKLEDFVARLLT